MEQRGEKGENDKKKKWGPEGREPSAREIRLEGEEEEGGLVGLR